jgi:hypothetical protein
MRIALATPAELTAIHAVYAHGRAVQQATGSVVWPAFTDDMILREIAA